MPRLISIQTGRVQLQMAVDPRDGKPHTWETAFIKTPVTGLVRVARFGVEGDEQADRRVHGGPDKAVLAYAAEHYAAWAAENVADPLRGSQDSPSHAAASAATGTRAASGTLELDVQREERPLAERVDYIGGGFGENLTIEGLNEDTVCIGDSWRVGEVLLQVSQPRQPCWKLGRRWCRPDLPKRVIATGRTGWYHRVLRDGTIEAGMELVLVERPHPEWTVSAANGVMYARPPVAERRAALAEIEDLSVSWREELRGGT
jgi:MOSC domain-containing protein YiiM